MDLLEIFLGQIPEAIYFALFMMFAKDLKEKRILYILLIYKTFKRPLAEEISHHCQQGKRRGAYIMMERQ